MAYTVLALSRNWTAAARFTVAANTSCEIVNPQEAGDIHYVVTNDDVLPALPVQRSGRVRAGEQKSMTLFTGERLWVASDAASGAVATVNH